MPEPHAPASPLTHWQQQADEELLYQPEGQPIAETPDSPDEAQRLARLSAWTFQRAQRRRQHAPQGEASAS